MAFRTASNAGGGGERVLWTAIASIQRNDTHVTCVVYTGDTDASPEAIIQKVKVRCLKGTCTFSLHAW